MNKNSVALLVPLILIGVGLFAAIDWQRGKALPPEGLATSAVSSGGLRINSVIIPGDSAPLSGTAPSSVVPAMPAASGDSAACP